VVEWLKRCPNPHNEGTEVEIRPGFEAKDFGPEMAAELKKQEERRKAEMAGEEIVDPEKTWGLVDS
jgi:thioredoxin reductase